MHALEYLLQPIDSLSVAFQQLDSLQKILAAPAPVDSVQHIGAAAFGALLGWYVYYVNRYRKGDVQLSDLTTVIGVLGGASVLALFKAQTTLFGFYGIGLAIGFFGYFLVLALLVAFSKEFDANWFLDGRRRKLTDDFYIPAEVAPTIRPAAVMGRDLIESAQRDLDRVETRFDLDAVRRRITALEARMPG